MFHGRNLFVFYVFQKVFNFLKALGKRRHDPVGVNHGSLGK